MIGMLLKGKLNLETTFVEGQEFVQRPAIFTCLMYSQANLLQVVPGTMRQLVIFLDCKPLLVVDSNDEAADQPQASPAGCRRGNAPSSTGPGTLERHDSGTVDQAKGRARIRGIWILFGCQGTGPFCAKGERYDCQ